jgi:hypothetical protein
MAFAIDKVCTELMICAQNTKGAVNSLLTERETKEGRHMYKRKHQNHKYGHRICEPLLVKSDIFNNLTLLYESGKSGSREGKNNFRL